VGRKCNETEFWGPKKLGPTVTNSCQNAVLWSLWLRKSKLGQYFHCRICITEFPDQVVVGPSSNDKYTVKEKKQKGKVKVGKGKREFV